METLERTGAASPQKVSAPLKRRKPDSGVSPQKGLLTDLPGDLCGHCNERCTESGKQGQAIECDLCGAWVHALCEGVNTDHYQSLVSLSSNVEGLTYLCKLNSCQSRFKQMVSKAAKASNDCDKLHSRLDKIEAKLDKFVEEVSLGLETHRRTIESIPKNASAVESKLNKVVQELGTKLDGHCETIKGLPANVPDLTTTVASVTSSLATEQREREKCQLNLILRNAPESKATDPQVRKKEDIDFAQSVFSEILNTPATVTNAIRLGKKDSCSAFKSLCRIIR